MLNTTLLECQWTFLWHCKTSRFLLNGSETYWHFLQDKWCFRLIQMFPGCQSAFTSCSHGHWTGQKGDVLTQQSGCLYWLDPVLSQRRSNTEPHHRVSAERASVRLWGDMQCFKDGYNKMLLATSCLCYPVNIMIIAEMNIRNTIMSPCTLSDLLRTPRSCPQFYFCAFGALCMHNISPTYMYLNSLGF